MCIPIRWLPPWLFGVQPTSSFIGEQLYSLTARKTPRSPYFPNHCKSTSRAVDGRLQVFWSERQEASTGGCIDLGTSAVIGQILPQHQTRVVPRVSRLNDNASDNDHFTHI